MDHDFDSILCHECVRREQPLLGEVIMGLINWIFDFYQQSRIERLQEETLQARARALAIRSSSGNLDLERLERAIGELALAVKAVQRVAIEKGLCTPSELQQIIRQIDLEDGELDGRTRLR